MGVLAKKSDVLRIINKYSYGDWRNGNLPEWCYEMADEYPDFLAKMMVEHFTMTKREVTTRHE